MIAIRPHPHPSFFACSPRSSCSAALLAVADGDVEPPAVPPARPAPTDRRRPDRRRGRRLPARGRARPRTAPTRYAALGDAYLAEARETGDPGYYSRAERASTRRSGATPRRPRRADRRGHAGRAPSRLPRAAAPRPRGARALAPELARPLPVIADAQVELGRYGDAARTIQRHGRRQAGARRRTRARRTTASCHGDLPGAIEAMRLAVSAGGAPENVAYVQVLLGDLELQRGRVGAARAAYRRRAALAAAATPPGLVGLARADAAGGDLGRAAARLRRAVARLPLTSTLDLLAEAELALGTRQPRRPRLATARAQQRLLPGGGDRAGRRGRRCSRPTTARPAAAVALGPARLGARRRACARPTRSAGR